MHRALSCIFLDFSYVLCDTVYIPSYLALVTATVIGALHLVAIVTKTGTYG